jgi:hypothetical protein
MAVETDVSDFFQRHFESRRMAGGAMLAVGIRRRTLRKPQALNGALRQFASVTSLSREGGKSSIRSADILSHFILVVLADLQVPARELRSLFSEART